MKCSKCNAELVGKFCHECGTLNLASEETPMATIKTGLEIYDENGKLREDIAELQEKVAGLSEKDKEKIMEQLDKDMHHQQGHECIPDLPKQPKGRKR